MRIQWILILLPVLAFSFSARAKPLPVEDVPAPLKPWVKWVLQENEEHACPFLYQDVNQRRCVWPTSLKLILNNTQGRFSQGWSVYKDSWLTLPGATELWPQAVTVNNKPAIINNHQGKPAIFLKPGTYTVSGRFLWDKLPESLTIPEDTGLLELSIHGKNILFPDRDNQGRLWLRERDTGKAPAQRRSDKVELKVYRRITDEIPLQVTTHIDMQVSGKQRELVLGTALKKFIPLHIRSPLPARLEPDDNLRVQIRAGRWQIELTTRLPGQVTTLAPGKSKHLWPKQEVWVFEARNHLRLVEIEGLKSIDPRQTTLPRHWQELPAYSVSPGESMVFKPIRRGDPDPEPDKLSLQRLIWLDFDGNGYTFKDRITGSMTRGWRLNAATGIDLGRVSIDGEPQFITREEGDGQKTGVEVRRGKVNLKADSRYPADVSTISATGWDHDFYSVSSQLELPPGYKLFSVSGTDNNPHTWLQRWSLLDLFLVLIISLAVTRLWSWQQGIFALITTVLIWHEAMAPQFIWLNLLAAIALLRVLPSGRIEKLIKMYRNLSLLALIIIVVPFMVHEVRTGLYPQLEYSWKNIVSPTYAVRQQAKPETEMDTAGLREEKTAPPSASLSKRKSVKSHMQDSYRPELAQLARNFSLLDPKANIQTGFGTPEWSWQTIHLKWNGPVSKAQEISFIFIPPWLNLLLSFLRVILLAALAMFLIAESGLFKVGWQQLIKRNVATASVLLLLSLFSLPGQDVSAADMPSKEMLKELKERLLEPPNCKPTCAEAARLRAEIQGNSLLLRLELHAKDNTAVILPGIHSQWLPSQVSLDGKPAQGLYRSKAGHLWINLPKGVHQILMRGRLPEGKHFQLPLPLRPHRVEVSATGWTVEGLHENGLADQQLQFTRDEKTLQTQKQALLEPGKLPAFVRIERTLHIGLEWQIETRVSRISSPGTAVVLNVPLLQGEAITTDGIRVEKGKVLVSLAAKTHHLRWQSVLKKQPRLTLTAPQTTSWVEIWRADISPIWHLQMEGIPVVHHKTPQGNWLPEWRPWPGEKIKLAFTRPQGVAGRTLTIDNSHRRIKAGKRASDTRLTLNLRSSQGQQHSLTLPEHASLQSVLINDIAQPIRQEDRKVTLPISPGKQKITLSWRDEKGIGLLFRTPKVNLGTDSVNTSSNILLGRDRWVLLAGGPRMGPAVLFWGVLIVVVLIAYGLGKIPLTPIKSWQWILLGIGLTQIDMVLSMVIIGWLFALGWRARIDKQASNIQFNLMQVALLILSLLALVSLFMVVERGLLGHPDMQVVGNQSHAYDLKWFQDRSGDTLPTAWVLSVPLLIYRLLMLAWALWLAFSLLQWLKWGWSCISANGLWREIKSDKKKQSEPSGPAE